MQAQRQVFALPEYTTIRGQYIPDIRIGYETYGTLNSARDNAIWVCHFYSGTAHAAGRYHADDPLPGWWNSVIGPGKTLDTDRYFIICSDTLCCVKAFDGQVVTTGPATTNPATGKPWGLDFPIPHFADLVHVQKALLDHLGIRKLVAVAGPSAGASQAIQWSIEYPEIVPRVIAVISPGLCPPPYARAAVDCWASPIPLDPDWQGGRYDPAAQPMAGLTEAYRLTNLAALSHDWVEKAYGNDWAEADKNPNDALENQFNAWVGLGKMAAESARVSDANHFLYMARICGTLNALPRIGEVRAKYLFLPAASDLLFPPWMSERAVDQIRAAGGRAELQILAGNGGHFDGLTRVGQARDTIDRFLTTD